MKVTVEELLALIGAKEVQIVRVTREVERLQFDNTTLRQRLAAAGITDIPDARASGSDPTD